MNNTAITELEENTFYEITFDNIYILNATKLNLIATNAFTSNNRVTKTFESVLTPLMNSPPSHDIFITMSSMINIENILIRHSNLTEIPSYAFRPVNGTQTKLKMIHISHSPSIKQIGNYSLYYLNNLREFSIENSSIDFIPTDAFHFEKESNDSLTIYMSENEKLNGSGFAINSLSNIKRPTIISFSLSKKLTFLDQKIFLPFFSTNSNNKIGFYGTQTFNCDDCRSYWILRESKYLNRTDIIKCSNGNDITNNSNFKNCK